MPKTSFLRNYSKTSKTPRRPFEKERIDGELKLVGASSMVLCATRQDQHEGGANWAEDWHPELDLT